MSLRAPIISVMGHVDAGKTSLMDMLRGGTKVQANEAGGITQSISCSMIPIETVEPHVKVIEGKFKTDNIIIPGLLMIDTPGHMSFNIMRERGSSLCDIAIVVIGLHEGIKPQTIESIEMLKSKKVPFIIAMSKLDMLDGYNKTNDLSLQQALRKQSKETINYMESYIEDLKYDLSKLNITAEFYHRNKKPNSVYSIVPVSSKTKEGLSDILALLVYIAQNMMNNKLIITNSINCTTMECIQEDNMWVIDVILKNGYINIGDKFAVAGDDGEKLITVRNMYSHNLDKLVPIDIAKPSAGIRLICSNAEGTYTGVHLYNANENEEKALEMARTEMKEYWSRYKMADNGIVIMAPTFGELDAMYNVYTDNNIPIRQMLVGKIKERHIKRLLTTMNKIRLQQDMKEYRCIIYFDDIMPMVYDEYIKLLTDDKSQPCCHLICDPVVFRGLDLWLKYKEICITERKQEMKQLIEKQIMKGKVVVPCRRSIIPHYIFMKGGSDDIMLGVKILNGKIFCGTPLSCNGLELGKIIRIEKDKKTQNTANAGDEVCIRIENKHKYVYDKNFTFQDSIVSAITRESIDTLKMHYKDEMTPDDWALVILLMKKLNIPMKKSS